MQPFPAETIEDAVVADQFRFKLINEPPRPYALPALPSEVIEGIAERIGILRRVLQAQDSDIRHNTRIQLGLQSCHQGLKIAVIVSSSLSNDTPVNRAADRYRYKDAGRQPSPRVAEHL